MLMRIDGGFLKVIHEDRINSHLNLHYRPNSSPFSMLPLPTTAVLSGVMWHWHKFVSTGGGLWTSTLTNER